MELLIMKLGRFFVLRISEILPFEPLDIRFRNNVCITLFFSSEQQIGTLIKLIYKVHASHFRKKSSKQMLPRILDVF